MTRPVLSPASVCDEAEEWDESEDKAWSHTGIAIELYLQVLT